MWSTLMNFIIPAGDKAPTALHVLCVRQFMWNPWVELHI